MAFWTRWKTKRADAAKVAALKNEVRTAKRSDGWMNILSRIGTERDRRIGGDQAFTADAVSIEEAEQLWIGSDLAAKVIEVLPKDTLRPGWNLKGFEKEIAEKLQSLFESARLRYWIARAMMFKRAYGGAALFPAINDGGELSEELDLDRIQKIEHFILFQPNELHPVRFYSDPFHPKYGEPELYRLQPLSVGGSVAQHYGELVHESRLIIFDGLRVTRRQTTGSEYGWGDSSLTRVRAVLRDFEMTWGSVASTMHRFSLGIFKMQGLAELIANDQDEVVLDRMIQADMGKSVVGSLVVDSEDDYTFISTSLAGMADMLDRFGNRFAMAADMPVTMAIGTSPAGLNATGESDSRQWYDRCDAYFEEHLPQIERCIRLFLRAKDSPTKGVEPEVWSVEKKSNVAPSEKETVETRDKQSQTDERYWRMGVLTEKTIRESRFGGDTYSIETIVDLTEYAEMDRVAEEAITLEAEAKKASLEAVAANGGVAPGAPAATGAPPPKKPGATPPPTPAAKKKAAEEETKADNDMTSELVALLVKHGVADKVRERLDTVHGRRTINDYWPTSKGE